VNIFQISLSVLGNKKLVNVFQEQHKELESDLVTVERQIPQKKHFAPEAQKIF